MTGLTMPYQHLGEALATDYSSSANSSPRSSGTTSCARGGLSTRRYYPRSTVLGAGRAGWPLFRRLGELGLVGDDIEGYGCPGMSSLAWGLVHMEVNRGDGSLGTFLGVQAGLAMRAINLLGSDEQRERWLPGMARVEQTGAFALTEPDHGSDSVALETARAATATSG